MKEVRIKVEAMNNEIVTLLDVTVPVNMVTNTLKKHDVDTLVSDFIRSNDTLESVYISFDERRFPLYFKSTAIEDVDSEVPRQEIRIFTDDTLFLEFVKGNVSVNKEVVTLWYNFCSTYCLRDCTTAYLEVMSYGSLCTLFMSTTVARERAYLLLANNLKLDAAKCRSVLFFATKLLDSLTAEEFVNNIDSIAAVANIEAFKKWCTVNNKSLYSDYKSALECYTEYTLSLSWH